MTDMNSSSPSLLTFEVISTRTINDPTKYVVYSIRVLRKGPTPDNHSCLLERRYTEFLELYTKLRQEFPDIFSSVEFPKKAMVGNFSAETIASRSTAFEYLLTLLVSHDKVRESATVMDFFLIKELTDSLKMISDKKYSEAAVVLENSFYLLNKLLTPRHPQLLRLLCLLVGCCDAAISQQTRHFAMTAVQRFEAVSDTDLLRYYVPLLQLTATLLQNGDKELLQERLCCMKRRGMRVDGCPSLLEAVLSDLS
ncbi:sorting nexin-21 [Macrosteles quadrilineatus]|uniref:sorting nexin-21 n=1 Tax=Macrosteles quadrilineatus TaxID=74068 RepID=UPI0023E0912C|nr:sorting nexin-21 [Macrosteles quadrilineatus]